MSASGLLARLAGAPRWLLGLALVALFVAEPLVPRDGPRIFAKLEAIAYDARLALTQPRTPDPQAIIVDIDERSLKAEGRWPWPRDKLAALTRILFERYHVRAVGFDIVFPEADTSSGMPVLDALARGPLAGDRPYVAMLDSLRQRLDYDQQFAAAIAGRPVVLGFAFPEESQQVGLLPSPAFTRADLGERSIPIRPELGYIANVHALQRAASDAGHLDPVFDADGLVRRVPLIKAYGDAYYPSLALALARVAVDARRITPRFDANGDLEALDLGGLIVPVAADATALIPYRGPKQTFRYVSATDVLYERARADFDGAIAVVGTTAKGLLDLRSTPMGPDFPGVEIHANLLTGMLDGELNSVPAGAPETEALIMALAGLLAVFAIPWKRPFSTVLAIAGIAAVVIATNVAFWHRAHAVIPLAPTLVMLLVLLVFTLLTGFLREARAIRKLSDMFGEYVPQERVAQMRESGQRFSLEGESRELTVLFSDVRNFTSMSEHLPPRALAELMNTYLTALTAVIHDARGTVDKYIGDAIMAFWGAPQPNAAHARDAIAAALAMQARMEQVRLDFLARGWPALSIGIGVNTGVMSVGDMGSRFRKAYTVMGDAVNLASRLEELTKLYGIGILVGDETRKAVPDLVCREVDRVRVRGRASAVAIWQPLGFEADDRLRARLALWHEALALYRGRRFADARRRFVELGEAGDEPRLIALFRDRCDAYAEALLPADWDGAATMSAK